jgi:hypothetical protein
LAKLAEGLGNIAPALGSLAVQLQEKRRTEGIAEGRARFAELAQDQEDFGSAMRQGLIEAKDNPFFRAGLLEAAGVVTADRYGHALKIAAGDIEDRSDMAAFDKTQQAVYDEVVAGIGPEGTNDLFDRAFQNRALGHSQSERSKFAAGVSPALLEQRKNLLYEEAASTITIGLEQGLNAAQCGAALTRVADTGFVQGLRAPVINEIVSKAIVARAVDLADTDGYTARRLLEVAKEVFVGPEGDAKRPTLFHTKQAQAVLVQAETDVARVEQNAYRFGVFKEAQERKAVGDQIVQDAMELYIGAEDVDDVNLEPLLARATVAQLPTLVGDLQRMRENFRSVEWYTDQEKYAQAQIDIWAPGSVFGIQNVSRMLADKDVTTPDARALISEIQQRDSFNQGSTEDHPLKDINYNEYPVGYFTREFRDEFGISGAELSKRANLAYSGFRADYLRAVRDGTWAGLEPINGRDEWLRKLARAHIDLRGGGRTSVETVVEAGSKAGRASIHNPVADWTEVLVLTRTEIARIREADSFADLSHSDQELIWFLATKDTWKDFIAAQNRLLLNFPQPDEGGEDTEE